MRQTVQKKESRFEVLADWKPDIAVWKSWPPFTAPHWRATRRRVPTAFTQRGRWQGDLEFRQARQMSYAARKRATATADVRELQVCLPTMIANL